MKAFLKKSAYCLYNLTHNRISLRAIGLLIKSGKRYTRLRQCSFVGLSNGTVSIGERCFLSGVRFYMREGHNSINIGNRVMIFAHKQQPTYLNACQQTSITIGDDCLFSNNIEIHTTDYHNVYHESQVCNEPADVVIGNHCWLGLRAVVLKGVHLADDSVVGSCSLVTKSFTQPNTMIAGVPGKIIKQDITWKK